jgi:hypothetical protein
MTRPDCPECGEPLAKPFKSCTCGWRDEPKKRERDKPRLCPWNDHGDVCGRPGHLSDSVVGGGPWYCREHFARLKGWSSWEAAVTDESMAAVDARVNKLVPRLEGESEHDWSMRCRDWTIATLKKRGVAIREPGEDREEEEAPA